MNKIIAQALLFLYLIIAIQSMADIVVGILERDKFTSFCGTLGLAFCVTVYISVNDTKKP